MRRLRRHPDDGFSLIEVIVAIVIIGIVASSALWFFINGMQTSSNLNRQQTAVTIATSTMENSFVLDPRVGLGETVSGLVKGRPKADVDAAFAYVAPRVGGLRVGLGIDGVADTYPLSDPAGGTPLLPIKDDGVSVERAGVKYTVYTLVGACYRDAAVSGAAKPCQKVAPYDLTEPPASAVGTRTRLLRIIVVVTWAPIGDECKASGGLCSYDVSTLVDPSLDLAWNRVIKPVALPDDYPFSVGEAGYELEVLSNDVLGSVRSWPVQLVPTALLDPSAGTVTINSNGTITYVPPLGDKAHWVSGIFDFNYRVYDRGGASSEGTVSLKLKPLAFPDTIAATVGISQVLDVLANDLGSPTLILPQPALCGSVSAVGTTVTYVATKRCNDTFLYTFSDASGQTTEPVQVTVNVEPIKAQDFAINVPYITAGSEEGPWNDISGNIRGSAPAEAKIVITEFPQPSAGSTGTGTLRIDGKVYEGGTVTGTTVEYQPPVSLGGEWKFPFKLSLGGEVSDNPATGIIRATAPVPPKAVNDPLSSKKTNEVFTVLVNNNDTPSTWPTDGVTVITLGNVPSGCGSSSSTTAADLAAGRVTITAPGKKKDSCSVTYTLTNGSNTSTATISYRVKE